MWDGLRRRLAAVCSNSVPSAHHRPRSLRSLKKARYVTVYCPFLERVLYCVGATLCWCRVADKHCYCQRRLPVLLQVRRRRLPLLLLLLLLFFLPHHLFADCWYYNRRDAGIFVDECSAVHISIITVFTDCHRSTSWFEESVSTVVYRP